MPMLALSPAHYQTKQLKNLNFWVADTYLFFLFSSDKTPPTIHNCPKDIYETSDKPKAVTWVEPTFSDNVKVTTVDKSHNSGDTFPLLETNVKYEVMDASGNRDICQFKVTLKRK